MIKPPLLLMVKMSSASTFLSPDESSSPLSLVDVGDAVANSFAVSVEACGFDLIRDSHKGNVRVQLFRFAFN